MPFLLSYHFACDNFYEARLAEQQILLVEVKKIMSHLKQLNINALKT